MKCENLLCSLVFSLACACAALATEEGSLDHKIQLIKQQNLELNRDLLILEEELLYPDKSRLAVFLSLDPGPGFALGTVSLSIDGKEVVHHVYDPQQLDALRRGGFHRLYMGNLETGTHELVAAFSGKGPDGQDYHRATQLELEKASGARNLELRLVDGPEPLQAEFAVREW